MLVILNNGLWNLVDITGGYMKVRYMRALGLFVATLCIGSIAISNNNTTTAGLAEDIDSETTISADAKLADGAVSAGVMTVLSFKKMHPIAIIAISALTGILLGYTGII